MWIGIEIGGTKIQLGVGRNDGELVGLWRGAVDVARGGDGIRETIVDAIPRLLAEANVLRTAVEGVGIGFGGPIDDRTRRVIRSHQIRGWDDFPLADWLGESLQLPVVLGNDADVAGLAEATHGAGRGMSPVFYITVGSGIGGGLIVDGRIARGTGRGAAEIGHLRIHTPDGYRTLEAIASGWGIAARARDRLARGDGAESSLRALAGISTPAIAEAAGNGDEFAARIIDESLDGLAEAICATIALVCPQCAVVGGGVSLLGEVAFFTPLRAKVAARVFEPFAGLTSIVPASLGEEVVVHGAIALAAGYRSE